MKINRAYKFRLYPNQEQKMFLNKSFGSCRFLWNQMLHERIQVYNSLKEDTANLYAHKYRTEKDYKSEFEFLKEIDSKALQSETRNLINAYKNFFRGLKKGQDIGFPKFKSRKNKQTYTTFNINNNIKIDFQKKKIKVPKLKTWIKFRDDRTFDEKIKHITLSKTKSGKFFVSILIERERSITPLKTIQFNRIKAFDMACSDFLKSTNFEMVNPRFYRKEEKKLKKLHRSLSRKKKGSNNRAKARRKLARYYEKIYNRKLDWIHKLTTELSKQYDCIILEDLSIKGMTQFNKGMAKSVSLDFSWHQFRTLLEYKMEQEGKYLIYVDRFFPSSKLCSGCGWKHTNLQLKDRTWMCQKCGKTHDRDINASQNLLDEGIKILLTKNVTVGTTGSHAWEDTIKLSQKVGVDEPRIPHL